MKLGIIGLGSISHRMADAIAEVDSAELVAVGSRSLEKAQEFAAKHGVARAYSSYEELCSDPEVEAVYISTPHGRHYEDAMLALSHGKHVLCEKAMTINSKFAHAMANEAKSRGLLLTEAMWTRFVPVNRHIVEWVSEGKIGEVRSVITTIGFTAALDFSHRLLDINLGGGALFDVGIYALEYIMMIYRGERPQKIAAVGRLFENGADAMTAASLEFASGTAQFTCALDINLPMTAIITGTNGSIEVCGPYMAPEKAILHTSAGDDSFESPVGNNGFTHELKAFIEAASSGKTECIELPAWESVLVAEINEEIKSQIGLKYPQDI